MQDLVKLNFELGQDAELTVDEFQRYSRQMGLGEIGYDGQKRLKATSVLVVGAGGIGSAVLMYIAGLGVGQIGIVDDDKVDKTNLHRQVVHNDTSQGLSKVR